MVTLHCLACGCEFGMPDALYEASRCTQISFYCPYGHGMYYPFKPKIKLDEQSPPPLPQQETDGNVIKLDFGKDA
jgi:hypothetical protein